MGGGASGPRPGGGSGEGRRAINLGYVAVIALALWALTGFYQNDAAERAVITRFGRYVATTQPGLHWQLPWPIEKRLVVNVAEFLSFEDRTRMLTQDEALVGINLAVQYRRADPVQFASNVRVPEDTLKEVSESAIREVIGQSKLDFVLEKGRQEISARTKDLIQRTITSYNTGTEIISVNLQDVIVPEQVAPAQKDAIKAREDRDRANLAAQTYANDILPKARGLAASQLEAARAHRERVVAGADGQSTRFSALAAEYKRSPEVTSPPVPRNHGAGPRLVHQGDRRHQGYGHHHLPAARPPGGAAQPAAQRHRDGRGDAVVAGRGCWRSGTRWTRR